MDKLRSKLEEVIDAGLSDEAVRNLSARVRDAAIDAAAAFEDSLKTDLSYNLARWVEQMAENAITAMLKGDDESMRKYLSCREGHYDGRDREHSVIRGELFETGAIELRKQVVNAHPELLKSQRILDLEDQVKSLVQQINKVERDREQLYERLRVE